MPRAHLDEGGDQFTNRAILLSSGQEHCQRINFHVLVSLAASKRAQTPAGGGHRTGETAAAGEVGAQGVRACSRPWEGGKGPVFLTSYSTPYPKKSPWGHTTFGLTVPLPSPCFPSSPMPRVRSRRESGSDRSRERVGLQQDPGSGGLKIRARRGGWRPGQVRGNRTFMAARETCETCSVS
jgi:hypothetical protein